MKLVVTVLEETCEATVRAIRAIALQHDMVEVRAEKFSSLDCEALQAATTKPIILTFRNASRPSVPEWRGLIDVEWREGVTIDNPSRTVISHHDYEGMRDAETIMAKMRALRCAYTKLAATPQNFADNERLLKLLPGTVIGMGERGLYSRILAPFRGSELAFVAAGNIAAPGQLTLERAREIYGDAPQRAERVFAIVGNPAGHSLSPMIHNRLFREKNVPAAYTIASIERFDEITGAFLRGEPCGLSVTTPFKEDAFAFASEHAENARRARAVNTLVNVSGRVIADNTDVDGFAALIGARHDKAAVLGAGPTARAALVALEDARIPATVYNRANMNTLRDFDGDLIINTLPPAAEVTIPRCGTYIEAAYSGEPREVDAEQRFSGLDLLHAQAIRQHQLFMKVFDGL
ncbi:MAG TPA: type I 3-dehydroquinate dehydratase [Thermoanaerobaculia bacterium]|jgi:3-dehydroquinate dehydratase|nr:type I 3-dehydroquinate dehydratase [Thermoanaerobaculia bacterium]